MIQYDRDGVTLFYIEADGNAAISHYYTEAKPTATCWTSAAHNLEAVRRTC